MVAPSKRHIPSQIASELSVNIWVEFIGLATKCKANLGPGFPDLPLPNMLTKHFAEISKCPERIDIHQYTRDYGHPRLVRVLAKLYSNLLGQPVNALTDVLVTVGAYMSLYYSFLAWLNPGDEVIIFEPAFDSYVAQIKMAGAIPVPVVLELDPTAKTSAGYVLNMDAVREKLTPKTKMMVMNNPNNPTGKLYSRKELEQLAAVAQERDLIVVTDEVYEWMIYPGHEMVRFASLPGMYERTITIGSAGKTFSATGFKTGWSIAPEWLLAPMKKIHENCVLMCPSQIQEILARGLEEEMALWESGELADSYLKAGLVSELVRKRDLLADALVSAGFKPLLPEAGYYMIADFSELAETFPAAKNANEDEGVDFEFCRWLCKQKNLAAIPTSAFYSRENKRGNEHCIRLCFFKKDETLQNAIQILRNSFNS